MAKKPQPSYTSVHGKALKRKLPCEDQPPFRAKRPRLPLASSSAKDTPVEEHASKNWTKAALVEFWRENGRWPREYFEAQTGQMENTSHLLARRKSSSSLRHNNSNSSLNTTSNISSDQKSRDAKSSKYKSPAYEQILATKGSFMRKSELDITAASKLVCETLLGSYQSHPENSLFQDDLFDEACQKLQGKNESRVAQDIARLIVPSAETLTTYGAKNLRHLVETVNESWRSSICFYGPLPQPDYAVGFGRTSFTDDQLKKLEPFTGEITDSCNSYFMATFFMYFPFLTCEVKCGAAALDIADRQNAHSMTIAARAVVELFKLVKREEEVNREILGFSISHDHRTVRLYGHYAVIKDDNTTYYRHPIHTFDFTALDGKEKWTAYNLTKNIYEKWMPDHLKRICSAIEEIPSGIDFDISHPELQYSQSNAESFADGSQLDFLASADVTPNTSFTQETQVLKRPRRQQ
ncbi:hypothetical protein ACJ72_05570 [Emergomyces africanus]|uniref:DUF7924 domain-containing protein n=1 Tax=Emergomyces africanus TaxID=1955775 RepID=A0A1B7NTP2_9EURO|nr:hypothetical protein ACJ72_05570 [Emergomyces africanus]